MQLLTELIDDEIKRFPPEDTRRELFGRFLRKYREQQVIITHLASLYIDSENERRKLTGGLQ